MDTTATVRAQSERAPDRIVMLNDSAFARGGATGLVRSAVRALRARGYAVTLLCGEMGDDASDPLGPLSETGAEVQCLGQARLMETGRLAAARHGVWNTAAQSFLSDWIRRHDTPGTVYHLHGWAQILSPAVLSALSVVAGRTVLHAHDFFLACPNGTYMDFPKGKVCERVPLSAACVATQCDKRSGIHKAWRLVRHGALRRALMGPSWGAIALINPLMAERMQRSGLDPDRFRTVLNPAEPFSKDRIEAERNRRFAFIGRLEPGKGPAKLAEAAARLGLDVTFIGAGPEEGRIRAALPSARITGWQPRDGIAEHLRDVRALVMPSQVPEPFGLVAAEASLSGLPVILTDISLLSAGVEQARLGLSYDTSRPRDLDRALCAIRDAGEDEIKRMSECGFGAKYALAQPEAAWVDGLLALYQDVLHSASQSEAA